MYSVHTCHNHHRITSSCTVHIYTVISTQFRACTFLCIFPKVQCLKRKQTRDYVSLKKKVEDSRRPAPEQTNGIQNIFRYLSATSGMCSEYRVRYTFNELSASTLSKFNSRGSP
ncbi:uncharacterized protein LOC113557717 [Rhopalosiphum maidis]|uniref:uncharacterized protein LOC113557717 n=1 Tax=Rhopalosiphum maidis TaxID=43146 RepID=UPI000EFE48AD|nr:uncharacterized protein LOC113557717 [Rhopalosiphum maidis]